MHLHVEGAAATAAAARCVAILLTLLQQLQVLFVIMCQMTIVAGG